jgi:multiple sugar transport system substrate-binding protein
MKKLAKYLTLTAGVVAAAAIVAAPSSGQSNRVQIDWWGHWSSAVRKPTVDRIVSDFNKSQTGVQVTYTFVPFDQIIQKVLATVAAGNPPCVVVLAGAETKIRASKNQLTDISAMANPIKDRYVESAWNSGTLGGKQYALPWAIDTQMLFWRKDLFREAGLNPDRGPTTWAELESYAAKLTKKDGNNLSRIGFHPLIGEGGFEMWTQNAGGLFFDAQGNPQVNNATAVKVLNWFQDWSDKYGGRAAVNAFRAGFGSGGGPTDPFVNGKVAMEIRNGGPFTKELSKNAPNVEYGFGPVPTQTGKQNTQSSVGSIFNIEIPRGCKNVDAAFKFASWLSTQGASIWAKEQNEPMGSKASAANLTSPGALKVVANLKNTRFGIAPTYAPAYGSAINKAVDDVMIGGKDPKAALDEAQAAIEKMVAENKK